MFIKYFIVLVYSSCFSLFTISFFLFVLFSISILSRFIYLFIYLFIDESDWIGKSVNMSSTRKEIYFI